MKVNRLKHVGSYIHAKSNLHSTFQHQYHICNFDMFSFDGNYFVEEKFSWLPSEIKVADKNLHF